MRVLLKVMGFPAQGPGERLQSLPLIVSIHIDSFQNNMDYYQI